MNQNKIKSFMKIIIGIVVSIITAALIFQVERAFNKLDAISITLAANVATVEAGKRERLEYQNRNDTAHDNIITKLDNLVTRREFDMRGIVIDSKFLNVEVELKEVQARIAKVEAQLVVMDAHFTTLDLQIKVLKEKVEELKSTKL